MVLVLLSASVQSPVCGMFFGTVIFLINWIFPIGGVALERKEKNIQRVDIPKLNKKKPGMKSMKFTHFQSFLFQAFTAIYVHLQPLIVIKSHLQKLTVIPDIYYSYTQPFKAIYSHFHWCPLLSAITSHY